MRTVPVIFARNRSTVTALRSPQNAPGTTPDARLPPLHRHGRQAGGQHRAAGVPAVAHRHRQAVGERASGLDPVAGDRARRVPAARCCAACGGGGCCSRRRTSTSRRGSCSTRYLVALFFNNLLPSNIGGDVVRISDTAKLARSKTLATTVVLLDRVMGVMALVLVAACGATLVATRSAAGHGAVPALAVLVLGEPAVLVLGRLRRRRGGHDARARRAGRRGGACCSR